MRDQYLSVYTTGEKGEGEERERGKKESTYLAMRDQYLCRAR